MIEWYKAIESGTGFEPVDAVLQTASLTTYLTRQKFQHVKEH